MATSKAVNLSLIPPTPELRMALVGAVDGRILEMARRLGGMTGDKLRRLAKIAVHLSQKCCFFCGKTSDSSLKKALKLKVMPWDEIKLCSCLADLRQGYREYYPWKETLLSLPEKVSSKELNPKTLMYSDICCRPGCSNRIEVTAIMIANNVAKYKSHQQMRKCKACRDEAARITEDRKQSKQPLMAAPKESNAAFPPRKARRGRQLAAAVTIGDTSELSVPLGEQLATKRVELSSVSEEERLREEQRQFARSAAKHTERRSVSKQSRTLVDQAIHTERVGETTVVARRIN